ncbi:MULTISPECIES: DoxX family protein [unclassified Streptosporangium]|uniref:DoxX family protein n=1 Tax=unclassified Streptosporangium TaxID=2632669 RepID=UPI002E2E5BEC|nr:MULTISPECIES: DoxX family protein [unclassified Streptosporangium]
MRKRPVTLTDKGTIVFAAYLVITLLASAVVGLAAIANLIGHEYPKKQADQLRVPRSWTLPLGVMLAAGSLGLLAGFAVPVLGLLAAAGLVLYFLGAFCVHLRARDHHFGAWSVFFTLAAAALAVNVAYY